jgi:2-oxoglutarate ferredoxin oxidoreductase subunit delta
MTKENKDTDTQNDSKNTCSPEFYCEATPREVKDLLEKALSNPDSPIFLFKGWCKKCGICVDLCPQKVFEWGEDKYPSIANPEKCRICNLCEYRCPDFAITVLRARK